MSVSFPCEVTLTPSECYQAATCGIQRNLKSLSRRSEHRLIPADAWGAAIEGAAAELAVAKAIGRYWDASVDVFGRPDLITDGIEIEVKLNMSRPLDGDLLIHAFPTPAPQVVYVLVLGRIPMFRIAGWIRAQFLTSSDLFEMADGRKNYIVSQSQLNKFPLPLKGASDELDF